MIQREGAPAGRCGGSWAGGQPGRRATGMAAKQGGRAGGRLTWARCSAKQRDRSRSPSSCARTQASCRTALWHRSRARERACPAASSGDAAPASAAGPPPPAPSAPARSSANLPVRSRAPPAAPIPPPPPPPPPPRGGRGAGGVAPRVPPGGRAPWLPGPLARLAPPRPDFLPAPRAAGGRRRRLLSAALAFAWAAGPTQTEPRGAGGGGGGGGGGGQRGWRRGWGRAWRTSPQGARGGTRTWRRS